MAVVEDHPRPRQGKGRNRLHVRVEEQLFQLQCPPIYR